MIAERGQEALAAQAHRRAQAMEEEIRVEKDGGFGAKLYCWGCSEAFKQRVLTELEKPNVPLTLQLQYGGLADGADCLIWTTSLPPVNKTGGAAELLECLARGLLNMEGLKKTGELSDDFSAEYRRILDSVT